MRTPHQEQSVQLQLLKSAIAIKKKGAYPYPGQPVAFSIFFRNGISHKNNLSFHFCCFFLHSAFALCWRVLHASVLYVSPPLFNCSFIRVRRNQRCLLPPLPSQLPFLFLFWTSSTFFDSVDYPDHPMKWLKRPGLLEDSSAPHIQPVAKQSIQQRFEEEQKTRKWSRS